MDLVKTSFDKIDTNNEKVLAKIGYLPIGACIVSLVVAAIIAILMVVVKFFSIPLIVLCIFFIAYPLLVLFLVKERDTITMYETFMLFHDNEEVTKINYEDIKEWNIVNNASSFLRVQLTDDQEVYKETLQASKVFRQLNTIIPDKEKLERMRIENRKHPLKFRNPFKKKDEEKPE